MPCKRVIAGATIPSVSNSIESLTGARLTGARLTGARLTGARLTGARLKDSFAEKNAMVKLFEAEFLQGVVTRRIA